MRVLHVIPGLGNGGGAERSLEALAPYLTRRIELHVAYFQNREELVGPLTAAGATTHSLGNGGRRHTIRLLDDTITSVRPNLIHTTLVDADLMGRIAGLRRGVPVVSSLVSINYGRVQFRDGDAARRAKRLAVWAADAATARSAVGFHALTNHVAQVMSRRLLIARSRITVIPRGRDPEVLGRRTSRRRDASRHSLGVNEGPLIVAAARHEHAKGLDVLLRAVPLVLSALPEARFVIGGRRGLDTPLLEALSQQLGLAGHVQFIGPRDDVADLMCAADVWCVPSRWEGFGSILVEAMALEVPVVASDLASIREVAGSRSPFELVRPDDPEALAAGIISVLTQPSEARQRTLLGRARFLDRFTVEKTSAQTIEFFEHAVASSRLRSRR